MKNIRIGTRMLLAVIGSAILVHTASALTTVHYRVSADFAATGVDTDAAGHVHAVLRQNGNSDQRRLDIKLRHLDPRVSYTLLAQVGDDTNNIITVTNFTTARNGHGAVSYFQNIALRSNGHQGHGAGLNRHALPQSINDLTDVRVISIADADGNVVLTVDMHDSLKMSYKVTSTLENTGNDPQAIGVVAMAVQPGYSTNGTYFQFRLFATGQSSEYKLAVNDTTVARYQADYTGRIVIGWFPVPASTLSPLAIRTIALKNAADQVVLQSNLR